jgi:hypothetical protein
MTRLDKIRAAKKYAAEKIGDILEKNFDANSGALETAGTFTALLEAHRAAEIAEAFEEDQEKGQRGKDYADSLKDAL